MTKHQIIEEPCEVKVSSTVLKTNGFREELVEFNKVGTFYPSSQTCNHCGFINPLVKDLKLREWDCPGCSSYNLRDKNAALNILSEGLRLIAAVGAPDAQNACGELVRPGAIQAEIVEAGITRL